MTVQLDWQPEGVTENIGAALGMDGRQVSKDLEVTPWLERRR